MVVVYGASHACCHCNGLQGLPSLVGIGVAWGMVIE